MNKEVTVTGMELRTKVSENLLIADDTLTSTARKGDNLFYNSLVQLNSDKLLEPVSSVNGQSFYYTDVDNVVGSGDAMNDVYIAYDPDDTAGFNTNYDTTGAKGYVDYVFQLKAITGTTAKEIRLTGLDLTYGGASPANDQKAYRVAVFAEDLGYKTSTDSSHLLASASGGVGTLKAIYTANGAHTFNYATANKEQAVNDVGGFGDVTYNQTFALSTVNSATNYYKVVVRLWLEGEDTTCNNTTFLTLADDWTLDLKWDLVTTTENDSKYDKVDDITLGFTTTKAVLTGPATAANTAAYTINGVSYYKINTVKLGDKDLYTTTNTGTIASDSKIFTIRDGLYPTDVTNQCTLPTT